MGAGGQDDGEGQLGALTPRQLVGTGTRRQSEQLDPGPSGVAIK